MNAKPSASNPSKNSIPMEKLFLNVSGIVILSIIVSTITILFVVPEYSARIQNRKLPTEIAPALMTINASQAIYSERSKNQRYGTMAELIADGYIDKSWASGNVAGYRIEMGLGSNSKFQYWVKATPLNSHFTKSELPNQPYYFTNQDCVVRNSSTNFQINKVNCTPKKGFKENPQPR